MLLYIYCKEILTSCLTYQAVLSGKCNAKVSIRHASASGRHGSVTAIMTAEITGMNSCVTVS